MANGIKKIIDYNTDADFRNHDVGPVCTFRTPCYPEFHIGDGVEDPGRFNYIRFTWNSNTRTEEHSSDMTQWGLFYKPNMHQVITFEDGTEWEITTQNKDADIAKIKDWIAAGFEFQSAMSRAARLLDDEMIYEI